MTDKQRRFTEEYPKDFNATAAAKRAGYSDRTAAQIGYENLRKPEIAAAIKERLDELSMGAEEATKRMSDWGRGTFAPFLTDDGSLDLGTEAARAHVHLLKKVKVTERTYGEDDEVHERRVEVELHDAKDAVKTVLQVHGKINQKVDVNVNAAVGYTADDLAEAAAELDAWEPPGSDGE